MLDVMTKRLEQALEAVRGMPAADQDAVAAVMLAMTKIAEPLDIEPEHLEAVLDGLAQADRGEFVQGEAGEVVAQAFADARSPR